MMIPQCSPLAGYERHRSAIDAAIQRVLTGGHYILGPEVAAFEEEFASWLGINHCIGVANGTDAVELALRALGIGPGCMVATVANTAVATVAAIERTGAKPCFVDIDSGTLTMSPASLEELLNVSTPGLIKAVVVVHLFGCPADLDALLAVCSRIKIDLIEDCAQAHGATLNGRKVGTFGRAAAFSFYPTKNLGALGDGGAVVTNDSILAQRLASLRQYGWTQRYLSEYPGVNSRLDELQAAILRVKLPYLDADNHARAAIAQRYRNGLTGIPELTLPEEVPGTRHVFHQYVIRSLRRREIRAQLDQAGIGSAIHYPLPIHLQEAYRNQISLPVSLPVTETVNDQILSLPMFPELSMAQVDRIIAAVRG